MLHDVRRGGLALPFGQAKGSKHDSNAIDQSELNFDVEIIELFALLIVVLEYMVTPWKLNVD